MFVRSFCFAAALAVSGSAQAQVTTLTFDTLSLVDSWYGDGNPLLSNMSVTAHSLIYFEQGYSLTYVTPNALPFKSHISDGTNVAFTFNWHTGFDNGADGYVVLSRFGGGAFTLNGFDYNADNTVVTAGGGSVALVGSGLFLTPFADVTSVTFTPQGDGFKTGLDNIRITAAPEAPAWVMLLAGFAAIGAWNLRAALRRRVQHTREIAG